MTRKQERARAKRRYVKRSVVLAQRERDRERLVSLARLLGPVVAVAVVAAILGPLLSVVTPPPQLTAAGCPLPPASYGTGAELTLPAKTLAGGKTWTATLTTNCGDIELQLDGAIAPQATSTIIDLARRDYYLNAPCHRLLASSGATVLQCGDPTGTGQGNPGFGYAVENAPKDQKYPRGTVAMARTNDPKKGTGAQFFLVDKDSSFPDPNGYTVVGTVTRGLDIVDKIVAAGVAPGGQSPEDGAPAAPISILRVAVTEKKA